MATPSVPAGWYPDPRAPHQRRYWNGQAWTHHVTRDDGENVVPTDGAPPSRRLRVVLGALAIVLLLIGGVALGVGLGRPDDDSEADLVVDADEGDAEEATAGEDAADGGRQGVMDFDEGFEDSAEADDGPGETELARTGPALRLGYLLPETGPLASLGRPQIESVRLALEDINAAGGVNSQDVHLEPTDEANDAGLAEASATRLVDSDVQGVVGAASSTMTLSVLPTLHDAGVAQCSPSNTSPALTEHVDNDYYVRAVPPDEAVAAPLAETMVADGHQGVALVRRDDDYGATLMSTISAELGPRSLRLVADIVYDPARPQADAVAAEVVAAEPDAIVLVGFDETADLIRALLDAGLGGEHLYGTDGLFGPHVATAVASSSPGRIAGMTVLGPGGDVAFNDRLAQRLEPDDRGNIIYGAQAYDCTIILALAAIAADSTDATGFNDAISGITRGGENCNSFEACKRLIILGHDIAYNGAAGQLVLERPDPTRARYAIGRFRGDGSLEILGHEDIDLDG